MTDDDFNRRMAEIQARIDTIELRQAQQKIEQRRMADVIQRAAARFGETLRGMIPVDQGRAGERDDHV